MRCIAAGEATFTAQVWSAGTRASATSRTARTTCCRRRRVPRADSRRCGCSPSTTAPGRARTSPTSNVLLGFAQLSTTICSTTFRSPRSTSTPTPCRSARAGGHGARAVGPQPRRRRRPHGVRPSPRAQLRMASLAELGGFLDDDMSRRVRRRRSRPAATPGGRATACPGPCRRGTPAHEVGHTQGSTTSTASGTPTATGCPRRPRAAPSTGATRRAAARVLAGPDRSRRLLRVHQLPRARRHLQQRPGPPAGRLPVHGLPDSGVDRPVPLVPAARLVGVACNPAQIGVPPGIRS